MIEPTSRDINRKVDIRRGDGSTRPGVIVGFTAEYVFVRPLDRSAAVENIPCRREALGWTPDRSGAASAAAARGLLARAGLAVDESDPLCWRVSVRPGGGEPSATAAFLFWPASGYFRAVAGVPAGHGASRLVAVLQPPVDRDPNASQSA